MEEFFKRDEDPADSIKDWRSDLNKNKKEENGKYSIDSLASPFSQVAAMLCRIHTFPNVSKILED